ncbi:MAG TPA: deoxynucleoside kinase [Dongiaceae bacterium]|nr:deoxynucleoside kinase [Dongiaceae bacterium]
MTERQSGQTPPPRFIVVEGPIGVGKTTLTRKLAQTFNYDTLLEGAEDNPFLERFYQNSRQWALQTQLYFLFQRRDQLNALRQNDLFEPVRVADFLIQKDKLFASINLDDDEFALYEKIYQHLIQETPKPDLVIYLQAPIETLQHRIAKRGIAGEQNISDDYLHRLSEAYNRFFLYYDEAPLLMVNTAEINLAESARDYENLVQYILTVRNGRHFFNPAAG